MAQSRKRSFKVIGFAVAYMVTLAALIIGGLQAQASAPTKSVPSDPASKIAPQVIKDTANGKQACSAEGKCPDNYHCVPDAVSATGTCWKNGSDPAGGN